MLRFLRQLLAFALGTTATCAFVVHVGLYASTFYLSQIPKIESPALAVVMTLTIVLFLLTPVLGFGCGVTTASRRDQETDNKPFPRVWRVVLFIAFWFVMINMAVFFTQTSGISHNDGPEPGRWAWFTRDGKQIRALTPEEHEWHNRLEVRFFSGSGIGCSLLAALVFFGRLPPEQLPRRPR